MPRRPRELVAHTDAGHVTHGRIRQLVQVDDAQRVQIDPAGRAIHSGRVCALDIVQHCASHDALLHDRLCRAAPLHEGLVVRCRWARTRADTRATSAAAARARVRGRHIVDVRVVARRTERAAQAARPGLPCVASSRAGHAEEAAGSMGRARGAALQAGPYCRAVGLDRLTAEMEHASPGGGRRPTWTTCTPL